MKSRFQLPRWLRLPLSRFVRLWWIRRYRNAEGTFLDCQKRPVPCVVKGLREDSIVYDDAIEIDYQMRQGWWVRGAEIERKDFKPNTEAARDEGAKL